MPVFRLTSDLIFPSPAMAEPDGLLAVGGDLSPERLLLAYSQGIFPWFNEGDPLLWWSPMPRCVLLSEDLHLSRSLRKTLRSGRFRVSLDFDFAAVIRACATSGERSIKGTWITAEMMAAYERLHALGVAHAVEVWEGEFLAGGLYGVALGRCFFGESMFHYRTDASKVALAVLCGTLFRQGFALIDMQFPTPHLLSLGARLMEREAYEAYLHVGKTDGLSLWGRPEPADLDPRLFV